jgi:hypothetical protein
MELVKANFKQIRTFAKDPKPCFWMRLSGGVIGGGIGGLFISMIIYLTESVPDGANFIFMFSIIISSFGGIFGIIIVTFEPIIKKLLDPIFVRIKTYKRYLTLMFVFTAVIQIPYISHTTELIMSWGLLTLIVLLCFNFLIGISVKIIDVVDLHLKLMKAFKNGSSRE